MQNLSYDNEYHDLWILLVLTKDAMLMVRENEVRVYGVSAEQAAVLDVVQALGDKTTPA